VIMAAGEEADARCADKAPVHAEHGYVKKIDAERGYGHAGAGARQRPGKRCG
jgi:hypothetical protein